MIAPGFNFNPDDPLAVWLIVITVSIVAVALFVANHKLKDRF